MPAVHSCNFNAVDLRCRGETQQSSPSVRQNYLILLKYLLGQKLPLSIGPYFDRHMGQVQVFLLLLLVKKRHMNDFIKKKY